MVLNVVRHRGQIAVMDITICIPDDIAERLIAEGVDLERRALEGLGLVEYKAGRLTRAELRRLLGFSTRHQLDGFLKDHGVNEGMTLKEFEKDRETLDRLGF